MKKIVIVLILISSLCFSHSEIWERFHLKDDVNASEIADLGQEMINDSESFSEEEDLSDFGIDKKDIDDLNFSRAMSKYKTIAPSFFNQFKDQKNKKCSQDFLALSSYLSLNMANSGQPLINTHHYLKLLEKKTQNNCYKKFFKTLSSFVSYKYSTHHLGISEVMAKVMSKEKKNWKWNQHRVIVFTGKFYKAHVAARLFGERLYSLMHGSELLNLKEDINLSLDQVLPLFYELKLLTKGVKRHHIDLAITSLSFILIDGDDYMFQDYYDASIFHMKDKLIQKKLLKFLSSDNLHRMFRLMRQNYELLGYKNERQSNRAYKRMFNALLDFRYEWKKRIGVFF